VGIYTVSSFQPLVHAAMMAPMEARRTPKTTESSCHARRIVAQLRLEAETQAEVVGEGTFSGADSLLMCSKSGRFRNSYKMEYLKAIELPILRASRKLSFRQTLFLQSARL
jgi:hypothetical protein